MANKDLTVVVTTFKSEDRIDACLNSIERDIRIIVIENSNNKKFKDYIENKFSNVECILSNYNLGYGKGNNIALNRVKTKYCLILNPDTILEKNSINKFFSFLEKKINFAILGPNQKEKEFYLKKNDSNNVNIKEVNSIKGFAMFLNMEKFSNIGFFDENIFLYLEEIDLCKRIKNINEKIFTDSSIEIFHSGGESVNKYFSHEIELTRNWHWMWSLFYYNQKHFNYFYALFLISPNFFSAIIKIFFYTIFLNKRKKHIYLKRLSGLFNSVLLRSSWYRPKI